MPEPELPVHFFTIVLNGEPFIRYHLDVFRELPFRWHWHVVEGVAELVHDTAWSLPQGGRIDPTFHRAGRSNDGTSEYLDTIAAANRNQVTLYRKPPGVFWNGKREMVAAPLENVNEPCLLWEVDADELWRPEQIAAMRQRFREQAARTAAYYWCDFFIAPEIVISTRYNYAQNPAKAWLRTWRFAPGMLWLAHEPPTLVQLDAHGAPHNVAKIAPFMQDETEEVGAKFQHFSYVTEEQLRFKEIYYGERTAIEIWRRLNRELRRSIFLSDLFPWVSDLTMIDRVERAGIVPWAVVDGPNWRFLSTAEIAIQGKKQRLAAPQIVLDATFTMAAPPRISDAWTALSKRWQQTDFADHVVFLDRGGMASRLAGLRYRSIPLTRGEAEPRLLQRVCDEMGAGLFVSARNTAPTATPAVFIHGIGDDGTATWPVLARATAHLVFTEEEKRRLLTSHPGIDPTRVRVLGGPATLEPILSALAQQTSTP